MNQSLRISPKSVTGVLLLCVVFLTLSGMASAYGSVEIKHYFVLRVLLQLFYLNEEANLPAWFSSLQWLLAALLAALIGAHGRRQADAYANHWLALGLIFLLLSADEAAAIHETLGVFLETIYPTSGYFSYGWVLIGIPFVTVFALAYVRFLLQLPPWLRTLFILAGVTYVFGALGLEMFAAAHEKGLSEMGYQVVVAIEEFSEMLGVVLLIYALLSHIDTLAGGLVINIGSARAPASSVEPPLLSSAADSTRRSHGLLVGLTSGVVALVVGGIVTALLMVRPTPPAELDAGTTDQRASPFVDRTISGELGPGDRRLAQDGSYVDVHELYAPGKAVVTIWMQSTDFDPYLTVVRPDGTHVPHNKSSQNHKWRVEFVAATGGSYRVLANAYRADSVGSYQLRERIRELRRRPKQPSPGSGL